MRGRKMGGASIELDEEAVPAGAEVEGPVPGRDDSRRSEAEVNKAARARRVVENKTYSHHIPLGKYLVMRLGEKGMENLKRDYDMRFGEKGMGNLKRDYDGECSTEQMYLAHMTRKPGVCKNPAGKRVRDVETLEEEKLRGLISELDSGVRVDFDHKGRPFVALAAMRPNNLYPEVCIARVDEEQNEENTTGESQFRGVEQEVGTVEFRSDCSFKLFSGTAHPWAPA